MLVLTDQRDPLIRLSIDLLLLLLEANLPCRQDPRIAEEQPVRGTRVHITGLLAEAERRPLHEGDRRAADPYGFLGERPTLCHSELLPAMPTMTRRALLTKRPA
jgi:hypothetical protein